MMGKRGPARTPTNILKMRGSWLADKRPDKDGLPSEKPRMPKRVANKRYAKAFWKHNLQMFLDMGLMTRPDSVVYEQWCIVFHKMKVVEELIDKMGGEICRERGRVVVNPACARYDRHETTWLRLADKFGCTPSARASIQMEIKDTSGKTDTDRFFGKKFSKTRA